PLRDDLVGVLGGETGLQLEGDFELSLERGGALFAELLQLAKAEKVTAFHDWGSWRKTQIRCLQWIVESSMSGTVGCPAEPACSGWPRSSATIWMSARVGFCRANSHRVFRAASSGSS